MSSEESPDTMERTLHSEDPANTKNSVKTIRKTVVGKFFFFLMFSCFIYFTCCIVETILLMSVECFMINHYNICE